MKKHILIYESIEVALEYSLNLILISELFAQISIIWLHLRLMCEWILFITKPFKFGFQKATAICYFPHLSTYMYEIKALHSGKCFLLFLSLIVMFMFQNVQIQCNYCVHFLVFSKIIVFRGGGSPDISKGFFLCNWHIVLMCFCFLGNLACLTDNCLLKLVKTCLINCDWLFTELSKGDWRWLNIQ